jgi:lysophospholipase L1-like esterase
MLLTHLATLADRSVEAGAPADPESEAVTIVTLGDSITKGVRPGVQAGETFAGLVQEQLRGRRIPAKVINVGIGGERTDQAPSRLATDVLTHKPDVVTVMYGTNDSYVDHGKDASRLSITEFDRNLRELVRALRLHGIEPVLMTEPRWAEDAMPNGAREHPNVRLERYVEACREVARDEETGLVDHFKLWTDAEANGQSLRAWTTDGCHPNGRGHHELAAAMLPVLLEILKPQEVKPVGYRTRLETIFQHDAGDFLWFHPRAAAVPGQGINGGPAVVMTLQKHLRVSDYYSGVSVMRSDDLGASWSRPDPRPELDWVRDDQGIVVAVADVTPGWHAPTGKLIAVGAQVRYSTEGRQLEDKRRAHQTAYAVYDPGTGAWSRWRVLEMPEDEKFNFARSACAQWLVEPDGTVLLPFYFGPSADVPHSVTVVRCGFDGERLRYLEHGNELVLNVVRGLVEPSLVRFQGRYYLTIRNDVKGYVTTSRDGLRYRSIQPWRFDDGAELGSYNTQQHWLSSDDGLFLVYTRRGANNDHIMRHRAPLFIAQVNPRTLRVMRSTEQVLVSERGATLGNFGASRITAKESWVTVAEGVWSDDARRRGAEGAVFVGRVTWSDP